MRENRANGLQIVNAKVELMKDLDIIAFGNAIVDTITFVPEAFLEHWHLKKGTTSLIKTARCDDLYKEYAPSAFAPGGCAANTMSTIALLGGKAAYVGSLKSDNLGKLFKDTIQSRGVIFKSPIATHGPGTGQCLVFVTPDKERTMETYLGASKHLNSQHIQPQQILQAEVLFLEAYLFDHDTSAKAALDAAMIAKTGGLKVALSCSDVWCIARHKGFLMPFIEDYVDILFGNLREVCALFDESDVDSCIPHLRSITSIACITLGHQGAIIIGPDQHVKAKSTSIDVVDTTGAGDGFAGGFLYGYLKDMDLKVCADIATLTAESAIKQIGFNLDSQVIDSVGRLCR